MGIGPFSMPYLTRGDLNIAYRLSTWGLRKKTT
jgi:hypothetical protein